MLVGGLDDLVGDGDSGDVRSVAVPDGLGVGSAPDDLRRGLPDRCGGTVIGSLVPTHRS